MSQRKHKKPPLPGASAGLTSIEVPPTPPSASVPPSAKLSPREVVCHSSSPATGIGVRTSTESTGREFTTVKVSVAWRIILTFMGLFFFLAAVVQYNDPDPVLWMIAYGVPCVLSIWIAISKANVVISAHSHFSHTHAHTWKSPTAEGGLGPKSPACGDGDGDDATVHGLVFRYDSKSIDKKIDDDGAYKGQGSTSPAAAALRQHQQHKQPSHSPLTSWLWKSKWSKYLSLHTIASIHILYCFALGLWVLWHYAHGITTYRELVTKYQRSSDSDNDNDLHIEDLVLIQVEMNAEEAKEVFGLCLVIAWLALLRGYTFLRLGRTGLWIGGTLTVVPFLAWVGVEIYEQDLTHHCGGAGG